MIKRLKNNKEMEDFTMAMSYYELTKFLQSDPSLTVLVTDPKIEYGVDDSKLEEAYKEYCKVTESVN